MKLSLLIPVLNEENNVGPLVKAVDEAFAAQQDVELEMVFIDDGSRDATCEVIGRLAAADPRVKLIRLSRNFGSHPALLAGFSCCTGDAAAYLAADLQDPPAVLVQMLERWKGGVPVVWGQRLQRDEPFAQKLFAGFYYRLMRRHALPDMPQQGLDLCLVDRRVIDQIVSMREKNTSIFGLILWAGFPQTVVGYSRASRQRGASGWSLGKKLKLVVDSFVAFSFAPIRWVTKMGVGLSLLGFLYGAFIVVRGILGLTEVQGWATLVTLVVFLSGVQLLMLGIVAEYLWRTLDESRGRPPFVIYQTLGFETAASGTQTPP